MHDDHDDLEDLEPPLGVVPVTGRGSLPFALVHGEALVAVASWALRAAGVQLLDFDRGLAEVRESGRDLVLHDPLCPLTPVEFLVRAVEEARATRAVVVGVRPVTDTVKEYAGTALGATHPRDEFVCITSPVVLPAAVLATLEEPPTDLARLVAQLVDRFPVRYLPAPPLGRRVVSVADLDVLAALGSLSDAGGSRPAGDPPGR